MTGKFDLTNVNNMAFYISGPKLLFETTEISTHPNSTQQGSNYIYLYTTKFRTSIKIRLNRKFESTAVDSHYLEFDGTMEKIRVNRSSTQEELRKYRKCSLFNDERETTRAKFWRAKTSIACLDSRNDLKLIRCFCCWFFSVKFFESCGMTDNC